MFFDAKIHQLSEKCGRELKKRGWTIATAESLTGGLLGGAISQISGSSKYYLGSICAYHNRIKREVLGVDGELLFTNGAVDKEVAYQMAIGVKNKLAASVSLNTTGFAGNGEKNNSEPTGLVYIGLVTPNIKRVQEFQFCENSVLPRTEIQRLTILNALNMLDESL